MSKSTTENMSQKYYEVEELDALLAEGIKIQDLPRFRGAYTATNVPVIEHLNYLKTIGSLEIQNGVLRALYAHA